MSEGRPEPEPIRLVIDEDMDERLDRVVSDRGRLSRSRVTSLIESGAVTVNGRPARKSYRPRAGDEIRVRMPESAPASSLVAEDLPVPIVYEDEHLVVVDKPCGMVVHPAPGHGSGTLVNSLLGRYGELSRVGLPNRPGVVHRLDRDTSGLLVVARRDEAHRSLAADLSSRKVERGYLSATWGHFDADDLTLDEPIGRHPKDRKRMAVVADGRPSVTHVKRLERWLAADLLAVRLETGRTHQIRVHCAHAGHPVVGDPVYGPGWERGIGGAGGVWAAEFLTRGGRMFLHAAHLSFAHPVSGETMAFTSPLPEPLAGTVEWARASC